MWYSIYLSVVKKMMWKWSDWCLWSTVLMIKGSKTKADPKWVNAKHHGRQEITFLTLQTQPEVKTLAIATWGKDNLRVMTILRKCHSILRYSQNVKLNAKVLRKSSGQQALLSYCRVIIINATKSKPKPCQLDHLFHRKNIHFCSYAFPTLFSWGYLGHTWI